MNLGPETLSAPASRSTTATRSTSWGLGTQKANEWAAKLQETLGFDKKQVSFLAYHGKNDDNHFDKLRQAISSGVIDRGAAERIVKTAKVVARLYALQLEEIDNV